MKSLDGGALFTRGAINKEKQNSNSNHDSSVLGGGLERGSGGGQPLYNDDDDSYHLDEGADTVNDNDYYAGGAQQKRMDTHDSHESAESKDAKKQRMGHMFMAPPGMPMGFGLSGMMGQMAMMKNMQ